MVFSNCVPRFINFPNSIRPIVWCSVCVSFSDHQTFRLNRVDKRLSPAVFQNAVRQMADFSKFVKINVDRGGIGAKVSYVELVSYEVQRVTLEVQDCCFHGRMVVCEKNVLHFKVIDSCTTI